jgi:Fe-S-cluster-containing hydrogenase component 2
MAKATTSRETSSRADAARVFAAVVADHRVMPHETPTISRRVTVLEERCLREMHPSVPCERCVEACRVGAVRSGDGAMNVLATCLGCGVCAAQCPSGAIAVTGFDDVPRSGGNLRIECARVPPDTCEPSTWIVPCVGGLRIASLVAAVEKQGLPTVAATLIDRGLCATCPVSGRTNLIADIHARLSAMIRSAGFLSPDLRIESAASLPADTRPPGSQPPRSRRAILLSFVRARTLPRLPFDARDDRAALGRLAARDGVVIDARCVSSLRLTDACADHGVCAAGCPTRALRRTVTDVAGVKAVRLTFNSAGCIGCGRCVEICPEGAMIHGAHGSGPLARTPIVLRERSLRTCSTCEDEFIDDSGGDLCPACRKSRSLFHNLNSGSHPLHGAPPPASSGKTS